MKNENMEVVTVAPDDLRGRLICAVLRLDGEELDKLLEILKASK